jgi:nucleoside-diphosphate-sugar epimerase
MATLITGFPRFVATVLVERLRQQPLAEPVHLVVMAEKMATARKSLGRPKAITLHRGDVANTDLGLTAESLAELLPNVRRILHFAQIHHPSAGRKTGFQVNVHGTQNVLRFAADCAKAQGGVAPRVVHLSSLFVLGSGSGRINAEARAEKPKHRNWWEAAVHQSEELVLRSGLPYTVLRPGLIIGDSQTGTIDKLGGLYELGVMASQFPRGLPLPRPSAQAMIHATAADTLADATVKLSHAEAALGRIIALDHAEPISAVEFMTAIAAESGRKLARWPIHLGFTGSLANRLLQRSTAAREAAYLNDRNRYVAPDSQAILAALEVQMPEPRQLLDAAIAFTNATLRARRAHQG